MSTFVTPGLDPIGAKISQSLNLFVVMPRAGDTGPMLLSHAAQRFSSYLLVERNLSVQTDYAYRHDLGGLCAAIGARELGCRRARSGRRVTAGTSSL